MNASKFFVNPFCILWVTILVAMLLGTTTFAQEKKPPKQSKQTERHDTTAVIEPQKVEVRQSKATEMKEGKEIEKVESQIELKQSMPSEIKDGKEVERKEEKTGTAQSKPAEVKDGKEVEKAETQFEVKQSPPSEVKDGKEVDKKKQSQGKQSEPTDK